MVVSGRAELSRRQPLLISNEISEPDIGVISHTNLAASAHQDVPDNFSEFKCVSNSLFSILWCLFFYMCKIFVLNLNTMHGDQTG
jgi:hypothetical protein